MAIPPISPVHAVALGVAAQAAGSAAASAFADLLRSAAALLTPESRTDGSPVSPPALKTPGISELTVLGGQIESLLGQIADRVRELFVAGNRRTVRARCA